MIRFVRLVNRIWRAEEAAMLTSKIFPQSFLLVQAFYFLVVTPLIIIIINFD